MRTQLCGEVTDNCGTKNGRNVGTQKNIHVDTDCNDANVPVWR
jgi:hypothetical protein